MGVLKFVIMFKEEKNTSFYVHSASSSDMFTDFI
jgi:hypothetical protein